MLGILVILFVSWVLLYVLENKNLSELGTLPIPNASTEFLVGLVLIAIVTLLLIG